MSLIASCMRFRGASLPCIRRAHPRAGLPRTSIRRGYIAQVRMGAASWISGFSASGIIVISRRRVCQFIFGTRNGGGEDWISAPSAPAPNESGGIRTCLPHEHRHHPHRLIVPAAACRIISASRDVTRPSPLMSASVVHSP